VIAGKSAADRARCGPTCVPICSILTMHAGEGSMVDRYTKAMLTVIAVALVGMVAQNAIGPLRAQSATRVVICDVNDINRCASLWPYTVQDTNQTFFGLQTVTPQ